MSAPIQASALVHVVPVSAPGVRLRRFVPDSPLEGSGFELSVPLRPPASNEAFTGHRVELYIDTALPPAERGAARFGGGDGSERRIRDAAACLAG
jgi:hypothetical protein